MKLVACSMVASVLMAAGSASAVICYGPVEGGSIPDDNPAGFSSTLIIDPLDGVEVVSLEVMIGGLTHTWAGDLRFTLTHGATIVSFVDRPGVPASTFGDSTDYGGDYTFGDFSGINLDLEAALAPLGDDDILPGGSYFDPNGEALSAFAGQNTAGLWILTVSDNAAEDLGEYLDWSLCVVEVPAPGAMSLLGLGGLAALRRRR